MKNFGFYKVAAACLKLKVGNTRYNCEEIKKAIRAADENGAKVLVTPELCVSGYTCGDLFFQTALQTACLEALEEISESTKGRDLAVVIGLPISVGARLYNCAAVIMDGAILGIVPKQYLPNYAEFYEKRWFASGKESSDRTVTIGTQRVPFGKLLFRLSDEITMGAEICEDLWTTVPPSSFMALQGANLIVNLSAGNETVSKDEYRKSLVSGQSARCICAYAYAGAGVHESTTDMVFSGACTIAENGTVLAENQRFGRGTSIIYAYVDAQKLNALRCANMSFNDSTDDFPLSYTVIDAPLKTTEMDTFDRFIEPYPFVPSDNRMKEERCAEILNIQAAGIAKRLEHTGMKKCIIGVSGGLDSTLALLAAVRTMDTLKLPHGNIIGIAMPGFGTTGRTYHNSIALMESLGVTVREIGIKKACIQHFEDIGHDPQRHDVTYENAQARERTQILMDIANKDGALLIGTGDLSEAAMGWCTYNGDQMSMYGANAGIPKTLMRHLVACISENSSEQTAAILRDILDTPVSPELLPPDKDGDIAQKTEDNIGPYELHDFYLYHFIRFGASREKIAFLAVRAFENIYDKATIEKWLSVFFKRFFASQFKRSCTPDAPKVGSVSLSPRGDWRMPSDADVSIWL